MNTTVTHALCLFGALAIALTSAALARKKNETKNLKILYIFFAAVSGGLFFQAALGLVIPDGGYRLMSGALVVRIMQCVIGLAGFVAIIVEWFEDIDPDTDNNKAMQIVINFGLSIMRNYYYFDPECQDAEGGEKT